MQSENNYNGIPASTLNFISKDPVILWGCTMAELQRGFLICFLLFFIPTMVIFSFIHLAVGLTAAIIIWILTARIYFAKLAKVRSDKPLFYDQHLSKKKGGTFIKPNTKYQRIKN